MSNDNQDGHREQRAAAEKFLTESYDLGVARNRPWPVIEVCVPQSDHNFVKFNFDAADVLALLQREHAIRRRDYRALQALEAELTRLRDRVQSLLAANDFDVLRKPLSKGQEVR